MTNERLTGELAWKIASMIKRGEISAEEYISLIFDRIEEKNKAVNAYNRLMKRKALRKARRIDEKLTNGERLGRLPGLGLAVKDNIWVKDVETTCSSKALLRYRPPENATVVQRIEDQDGIILGKANMDEFAAGSGSMKNSCFGAIHNPWDLTRSPGGSSAGSAAAVASLMATLAVGSDTGGSIRKPAGFCSILGLKPTYGLVSRHGLIPFAHTLDSIGPMARDARDCALLLSVMAGSDPKDATSVRKRSEDYTKYLVDDIRDMKIAVPIEFFENVEKPVERAVWRAIYRLEELGATYREVSIKLLGYARAVYNCVSSVEGFHNLHPYAGKGLQGEVRSRIILGYSILSREKGKLYEDATRVRALLTREFNRVLKEFDAVAGPTNATLPPRLLETAHDALHRSAADGKIAGISDSNRAVANLTGMPAMSLPCGFDQGLPIGLQLMAAKYGEDLLLRIAYAHQENTDYLKRTPPI